MRQPQGHQSSSIARPEVTFALVAGAFLVAAVVWFLVLGTGSTKAAGGHHHRGHHHHHHRLRVPKTFLGVLPGPVPFDPEDATKIANTKVRIVRTGLLWVTVQRQRGPFNWSISDRMVGRLAANGLSILPTLAGTPSWVARDGTTAPVVNAAAKRAWQTFVTAAVRRYGPGGVFWEEDAQGRSPFHRECRCGAKPVPIKAWQIWNEPNLKKYFTPKPSPGKYAELVKISRAAIDEADPDAKLVLAGLSDGGDPGKPGAAPFLKKFYHHAGIKRKFDAVSVHPYARNLKNLRKVITKFRRVMKQRHDKKTSLWVTEIGWGSGHPNRYGHNKGLHGQARLLKKSMTMLLKKRKRWHIGHAFWFFWRDPPKNSAHTACSFCKSAGLLRNNRKPKPAYKAFRRLAKRAH
jgi:polysaccharide biosynthesis protein PslG